MLFNSFEFWLFFALVILIYWRLAHRGQNTTLLIASYVFYGAWDWRFLSLILFSTCVDFLVAQGIEAATDQRKRRRLLGVSLLCNLGLLGVFKYCNFFAAEFANLLGWFGLNPGFVTLNIVLPVGISFYTFQTLGYTIDVYRGRASAVRHFPDFALYVAFFPQLVAGPIERSQRLLPQLTNARRWRSSDFVEGLNEVMLGLFKKVVVADNLAPVVNHVFSQPVSSLSSLDVLVGVYAFAVQIYCDFSGYSSIARGISRWLGIDLMANFAMPYRSASPQEFWRRWHISLSTWLRDYLYVSLGGNRQGVRRTYRNLLLTMTLGGLWHGAAWTFVLWGVFHGGWLALHRFLSQQAWWHSFGERTPGWIWISRVACFHLVCFGWLLFRAGSLDQVGGMLGALVTAPLYSEFSLTGASMIVFFFAPLFIYECWQYRAGRQVPRQPQRPAWFALLMCYCAVMMGLFPPPRQSEFLYFQF